MDTFEKLPLIPLRGLVVFPHETAMIDISRVKSVNAMERALAGDGRVALVAQRAANVEFPKIEDLYMVGCCAKIRQVVKLPDGVVRLLVGGEYRLLLADITDDGTCATASVQKLELKPFADRLSGGAHARVLRKLIRQLARENDAISGELISMITGEKDAAAMADMAAAGILETFEEKQEVLEFRDECERVIAMEEKLADEIQITGIERRIQLKVQEALNNNNKDFFLREQVRAINEELGDAGDASDIDEYREKLAASPMPEAARNACEREIKKLSHMPMGSPENSISVNYIEYLLELPWGKYASEKYTMESARARLDRDHFGMEDVKKRVLEYLAVLQIKGDLKGPILCFVGPPGVGKTSIARSVAQALGRKFARVSLGGVHDEAEIRGHRRTYMGALPGCVVSSIRQAGSMDPVILFDELDKMAHDYRGDPAAAMLEVLDSEQNCAFTDHYLDAPIDLSKVLFIATANTADEIPPALLDRMEIIEVPSYTYEEKFEIAKRHLAPKQLSENGLNGNMLRFQPDGLREIISGYTREAGVRQLERELGAVCRKAAMKFADGEKKRLTITKANVETFLGVKKYLDMEPDREPETGVVNALAWTSVGGETMPIEVAVMPGGGKLDMTGRLGDVMQESARTAFDFIRSRSKDYEIAVDFHKNNDLHIHVPEGAVPKDGPSAGVALTCAMLSAITGKPARQDVAMTGEVTLRGKVLPIGGLKEKLMAAYRMGINTVLMPEENAKDLEEVPADIRKRVTVKPIKRVEQAIDYVLMK